MVATLLNRLKLGPDLGRLGFDWSVAAFLEALTQTVRRDSTL